jgi:hypothetical protein
MTLEQISSEKASINKLKFPTSIGVIKDEVSTQHIVSAEKSLAEDTITFKGQESSANKSKESKKSQSEKHISLGPEST